MNTAAAVESVTKAGDKFPSTVLGGVNASNDSSVEASESIWESHSACDSDARSATITLSRKQLEQRDGSADTKIPSGSKVHSDKINLASRCGDGSNVFERCMILGSFLLALGSPLLLRHLYSEPMTLMWTIASSISAHIVFLIFIVSPTMCLSTIFHMPYPVMLATFADRFVGHCSGFLVMHVVTGWLAGVLGYAYAEHLQHIGRETIAKHITRPTFLKEEDERRFEMKRAECEAVFCSVSLLLVPVGPLPLWFSPREGIFASVAFLSVLEGYAIFYWVLFLAKFELYEAFLSVDQLGNIVLLYICPCLVMSLLLLLLTLFCWSGDTIVAMCLWFLMLSIAGLLGYELSVHAQCKQMILSRRAPELRGGLSSAAGESPDYCDYV